MSLEAALRQHVDVILRTASGAPPGGGAEWDGLLRHYGIAPLSPDERQMIVQYMHLARGAAPAEVRLALVGLQKWADGEAKRTGGYVQGLDVLVEREMWNYERAVGLPPPPPEPVAPPGHANSPAMPGLASIFANAQQTSKEVPWANMKYKQVGTLNCVHCGGPQEQPTDFMCRYCRRPIAQIAGK